MAALITVGSTRFDALVDTVLTEDCVRAFRSRGYTQLTIQYGNSRWTRPRREWVEQGIHISAFTFKPSLSEDIKNAELVVSHAGAGTILDVLRAAKPLIVVPNNSLMDDHQSELANELAKLGYLLSSRLEDLVEVICLLDVDSITPFPPYDGNRFRNILDREMGFL